jgi:Arc/MetJ-type ribon-helix-helix transcriptional regulator
MTIHVSKDVERSIDAAVQSGQFASADDMVATLVLEYARRNQEQTAAEPSPPAEPRKPIWERILERSAAIPDEEWNKLPVDGAEQHDHYLYGTSKRQPAP